MAACGHSAPSPAATPAAQTAPAAASTAPSISSPGVETPTAAAIERGRAIVEKVRAAAGGPLLTALKSFEATGTSAMTGIKTPRQLRVIAILPKAYRQEEGAAPGSAMPAPHIVIGLDGNVGWMSGARLGGDGMSKDANVAREAYTRAARQAMAGFAIGITTPGFLDSGRYTFSDLGVVDAGDDRGAIILQVDGPDGRVGRLLIDPGTYLPRRLIEPAQSGGGGAAAIADIVFTYSDFQPQAGLQLPRTIVRQNGPNRTLWTITKYAVNPPLSARRFGRGR